MSDNFPEGGEDIPEPTSASSRIDLQLARAESKLRSAKDNKSMQFAFLLVFGLGLAIIFFGKEVFPPSDTSRLRDLMPMLGAITICYSVVFSGFMASIRRNRISSLEQEIAELRAKRSINSEPAVIPEANASYFDRLVTINVTNLEAYYGLVKIHTNNSFNVALGAGCIGFLLIVTGIIFAFSSTTNSLSIGTLSAASGVITEFVAGVFFYLYNKTVRQLKDYHDSLLAVQNILLSFKIVEDTQDPTLRNTMLSHMINSLISNPNVLVAGDKKAEVPE